jgi:hypothetical protein
LLHIAQGIESEVLGRGVIKPLDSSLPIEKYYAIWRGLKRTQEIIQPILAVSGEPFPGSDQTAHTLGNLAPKAIGRRVQRCIACANPPK